MRGPNALGDLRAALDMLPGDEERSARRPYPGGHVRREIRGEHGRGPGPRTPTCRVFMAAVIAVSTLDVGADRVGGGE